ncbi:MAG: class D sortase [Clostridia bacterium]
MKKIKEIGLLIIFIILTSVSIITVKNKMQENSLKEDTTLEEVAVETEYVEDMTEKNAFINLDNKEEKKEEVKQVKQEKLQVKGDAIAVVDIPSIKLRAQVKDGTDNETLKRYAGRFDGSALPGQDGNFSIAAHNNVQTELFRNLHKAKKGVKITVLTKTHQYVYEVKSINKIKPNQVEVIDNDFSKKEITLITCSDFTKTRTVVKGTLVSTNEI